MQLEKLKDHLKILKGRCHEISISTNYFFPSCAALVSLLEITEIFHELTLVLHFLFLYLPSHHLNSMAFWILQGNLVKSLGLI